MFADPSSADLRNPKQLLIDGKWVPARSGKTFACVNPSTGEEVGRIAEADAGDIDLAVAAARRAFEGPWRTFTPQQRQKLMLELADLIDRHSEELHLLDAIDMGVPIGRPRPPAGEILRYFAGWATKIHGETVQSSLGDSYFTYTLKEPIGVCAAIIPWNGPAHAAVGKIAPVLATGCTMVLKPSEEASLAPLRIGELVTDLDFPPGVVNVVTGHGDVAGSALALHPGVDKIAFTGSTATGQKIVRAAAGNLKRLSLELGGKSPDVVCADADLAKAAPIASMAVFGNSGQVCLAGSRVFVERPVYDEFLERMSEIALSLKVGNSLHPDTEIGPLVSQRQLDRVSGYLELGREEGARLTAGGDRLADGDLAKGFFLQPTIFADVSDEMRIATEEIFGPVASVLPFDDMEEVARRANLSQFGLAGAVWTRDLGKAHRLVHAINTGVMWVNTYGPMDPSLPFGGTKMSGWGRERSVHALDEYVNVKAVCVNISE